MFLPRGASTTTFDPGRVSPPRRSDNRPTIATAIFGGLLAAAAAGALMLLLRAVGQVRSVPERLLEAVLIVAPLDIFVSGLQRFGFDAKRYALYASIAAVLLLLTVLGTLAIRCHWRPLVVAIGVWVVLMLALLPASGAGLFATELVVGRVVQILGHLAIGLVYAGVLAAMGGAARARVDPAWPNTERRTALRLLGGAAVTLTAIPTSEWARMRWAPQVRLLPVARPGESATLPDQRQLDPAVGLPAAADPGALVAEPQVVHPGLAETFPEPPPARRLKRDKDGTVLAAGRRPGEFTPLVTSNDDFYVVSKNAGGDPILNAPDWRLKLSGAGLDAVELDYLSLRRLPAVDVTKTLECISNFAAQCELAPFGCDLISTARWRGVRLSDVLRLAGTLDPAVVSLLVVSADEYTSSMPVEVALDPDTLLVYEMNGQVLPREHGYPVRLLVPGRYGLKNPKWVVAIRAMTREALDWYGERNWTKEALVHTMTRIDVPANSSLAVGEYHIAGIAYAGDRGISQVEFSRDGGNTWTTAQLLEPQVGRDTWVRWLGEFTLGAGEVRTLVARTTDNQGVAQPEGFSLPQPNGSTGWPSTEVSAPAAPEHAGT